IVYPPQGKSRVAIDKQDIYRLDEGEFLNDNLVTFYLFWLENRLEERNPDVAKRIYFHNSFFFEKLSKPAKGSKDIINYEAVKKWTAKVNLFDYDYIVVPVNENFHWYVAIICNAPRLANQPKKGKKKGPPPRKHDPSAFRIITLDSFHGAHSPCCTKLKKYLLQEMKTKLHIEAQDPGSVGMTAKNIPVQSNYSDCGLFLLNYIEEFLKN
ncbi:cysteine proteinase, partial [Acephala macrosclerotiorum]